MNALIIAGLTIGGAGVGFVTGAILGSRGGGDFNFAPAIYAPAGGMLGAIVGAVIGSAVFG